MADRIVTVDVQSNLREQTQEAKQLNKELDKLDNQRTASRTGSRAADAALGVSGSGMGRGTTGAGGRGGERDFARQAQGLGGLVHVYATFAANIYAVTAAFNALSKAQDTANMVAASQALSSSYGISLMNVSKQLSAITDGAISAKDALSFANLGGAAGLTSKQMNSLATVAKGASLALGRDLADAMQRIYRGAIKVEPELLDELGIMVKIDQATADYARTLGKSASSLTDYERRQAYVNAVIKEGSDKFGELANSTTNPYTKLLASTQNVIDSTGQVLNKFIGPLANALAESPTGLGLAIGGVASLLLKQAIPAITTYIAKQRELSSIASAAATKSARASSSSAIAAEKQFEQVLSAIEPTMFAEAFSSKAKKSKALQAAIAAGQELGLAVEEGFNRSKIGGLDYNKQLQANVDNYLKAAKAAIDDANKRLSGAQPLSAKNAESQKQIVDYYTKQLEIVKALPTEAAKLNFLAKEQLRLEKESLDTATKARQLKTQSVALRTYEKDGITGAIGVMYSATAKTIAMQTSIIDKARVGLQGFGQSILTLGKIGVSALPGLLDWLGKWGLIATAILSAGKAALTAIGWFSDSAEKAATAATTTTETLKTLEGSIDKLSKARSINSIFQLEGATLSGLAEARKGIEQMTEEYNRFAKGPILNQIIDQIPFLGEGASTKQAQAYAKTFDQLIASGRMTKGEASTLIQEATGVTGLFNDSISQTLEIIKNSAPNVDNLNEKFIKLNTGLLKYFDTVEKNLAANRNIEAGLKDLNKASSDFVTSLIPVNNLTKGAAAFASVISSLVTDMSSANVAKVATGITSETGVMLGGGLPKELIQAEQEVKAFTAVINEQTDAQLKNEKSSKKRAEIEEAASKKIKEFTDSVYGPGSFARKALIEFSLDASEAFRKMATQASDSAVALASLGQKLRTNAFVESIVGPSAGLLRERLNLEAQQRSVQGEALRTTEAQLSKLTETLSGDIAATLSTVNMTGYTPSQAIRNLMTKPTSTKEDEKALSTLLALNGQLLNQEMALYNVRAQLKVITMSANTAEVERMMIANQANKDTLEGKKAILDAEKVSLTVQARQLDQQAKLNPYLADTIAIAKEEIDASIKLNELKKQELELRNQIEAAATLYDKATTEAGKNQAAKRLNELGIALGSTLAQQADVKQQEQQNKLYLERIKLQNEVAKRIEVQNIFSQAATTINESLNTSNADRVKIYSKLLEFSKETNRLEVESLNKQLEIITANDEASNLERQKLEAKREYVQLQQREREYELANQQRLAQMKAAEETGIGMLNSDYWKNMAGYAEYYYAGLRKNSKSVGVTFVESMDGAIDTITKGMSTMLQKSEFSWKSLGDLVRNTFSDIFRDLASELMKMAIRMALMGSGGSGGGGFGGLLGAAISVGSAFMGGGGSTLTGNEAGIINNAVSQAEWANTFAPQYLAKGGVMTEYGPLKLNKYANGGIADSPQVAIYGEGSQNEAYVPLPDNRSIPVTLTGNSGGVTMGDTYINVKVDGTGTAETDVQSRVDIAKQLSMAIKKTVQDELVKASRPGGMLYGVARR